MTLNMLFEPFHSENLSLPSRIVMAPMTRAKAQDGVLSAESIAYYTRRAASGVGLIITEGTWIDHACASDRTTVPCFHGDLALQAWKETAKRVHQMGGKIMPQLWHQGGIPDRSNAFNPELNPVSPSGVIMAGGKEHSRTADVLSVTGIQEIVASYARGAKAAFELGFDGVEIHGGHGFLIDQFLWAATNRRDDGYNGDIAARTRFAAEVVAACRTATAPDFPILFRFSQWKMSDFSARIFQTPDELSQFLTLMSEAGVDAFHVSTRDYRQAAFEGSELSLAGWTRRLSGKPVIAVGGLAVPPQPSDLLPDAHRADQIASSLAAADAYLAAGEADLIAVGRALLADHLFVEKSKKQAYIDIVPFREEIRNVLY